MNNSIEYFGLYWMNILDFVLNWIIFRPDSMKKWIFITYRTPLVSNQVFPIPRDYTSRGSSRSRPPPPPQGKRDFRREVREDFNRSAISVLSFNYSGLFQGISLLCRGGGGSRGQWAFWMGQLSSFVFRMIFIFHPGFYPYSVSRFWPPFQCSLYYSPCHFPSVYV